MYHIYIMWHINIDIIYYVNIHGMWGSSFLIFYSELTHVLGLTKLNTTKKSANKQWVLPDPRYYATSQR